MGGRKGRGKKWGVGDAGLGLNQKVFLFSLFIFFVSGAPQAATVPFFEEIGKRLHFSFRRAFIAINANAIRCLY